MPIKHYMDMQMNLYTMITSGHYIHMHIFVDDNRKWIPKNISSMWIDLLAVQHWNLMTIQKNGNLR